MFEGSMDEAVEACEEREDIIYNYREAPWTKASSRVLIPLFLFWGREGGGTNDRG